MSKKKKPKPKPKPVRPVFPPNIEERDSGGAVVLLPIASALVLIVALVSRFLL